MNKVTALLKAIPGIIAEVLIALIFGTILYLKDLVKDKKLHP